MPPDPVLYSLAASDYWEGTNKTLTLGTTFVLSTTWQNHQVPIYFAFLNHKKAMDSREGDAIFYITQQNWNIKKSYKPSGRKIPQPSNRNYVILQFMPHKSIWRNQGRRSKCQTKTIHYNQGWRNLTRNRNQYGWRKIDASSVCWQLNYTLKWCLRDGK